MRNIEDVIDRIKKHVPTGVVAVAGLNAALDQIKNDAGYVAPEQRVRCWYQLCELLNARLPFPPQTPWQQKIHDIITAKE
jgi:hypothetical protein